MATFTVVVEGAGFALQDGIVLLPGDGEGPFEAAMAEAVRRLGRFRGTGRGRTCLFRVTAGEWLSTAKGRRAGGGRADTGPGAATDRDRM